MSLLKDLLRPYRESIAVELCGFLLIILAFIVAIMPLIT